MARICPNCGEQNASTAKFCLACGTELGSEHDTDAARFAEEGVGEPKPDQLEPRRSRKWIGCLGVMVLVFLSLPIVHLLLLRPAIERVIIDEAIRIAEITAAESEEYSGPIGWGVISESELDAGVSELRTLAPFVQRGDVNLEQDRVLVTLEVSELPLQIGFDPRADGGGNLLVRSIGMNLPVRMLLSEEALRGLIEEIANRFLLRESNLRLLAIQVNEGEIFVVFEGR